MAREQARHASHEYDVTTTKRANMNGQGSDAASRHVVVVGGGITGLAAAYCLTQLTPAVNVTLIEADTRLGGKIQTEEVDGFLIEGGPDSFLSSKPRGIGLCRELGLEATLQGTTPRKHRAFVSRRHRLHELPEGLTGLVPTRLRPVFRSRLIHGPGKVRFALDYLLPAKEDAPDETLGAFVRRRLGREVYDWLVEPLMAGIYAGNGDELSLAATFPQLRQAELEHGGLIKGIVAKSRQPARPDSSAPRPSPFLTPRHGLGALVDALARRFEAQGFEVRLGVPLSRVERTSPGANRRYRLRFATGEAIAADGVILATPAFASAEMIGTIDHELAATLREIPYASSAIVSLAFPKETIAHPLEGHGYLVPRAEHRPVLACTWSSRKWADRAPDDAVLMRVFFGRHGQESLLGRPDDQLIALAQAEIRRIVGIDARPLLSRVHRWPRGMPQYTIGHLDRLATIARCLEDHPGLLLAGSAYRGVGLPDCIVAGEAAAQGAHQVVTALAPPRAATIDHGTDPRRSPVYG
ncbi:MAG: protoporphyrinogen oxidase [Chloroflexota bacterium]|nr:protoporphyrinogen oxidase [Chloroflexota bacterium]